MQEGFSPRAPCISYAAAAAGLDLSSGLLSEVRRIITSIQTRIAAIKALLTGSVTAHPRTRRQVSPAKLPRVTVPARISQFSTAVLPCIPSQKSESAS